MIDWESREIRILQIRECLFCYSTPGQRGFQMCACLLVFVCYRVFIPRQVHILRILSLKSSF